MIEKINSDNEAILAYRFSGKVTLDEYVSCEQQWLEAIDKFGKIKMVIELVDLRFPEILVFFEDFKQGMKHCKDFSAFCVIGDHTWEKVWSNVFSTILHINVKYFDKSRTEAAWEWISQE
jgi:SpoIIAA-like